jgi:Calpain family cysteine protease
MLLRGLLGFQRGRRSGSQRRQRRSRRPALERLEQREVLSQIVTLGSSTYDLRINGDANQVINITNYGRTPITGTNTSVSAIAGTATELFMLGNNGGDNGAPNQVWEYGGSGTNWTPVTAISTTVSQIATTGNSLFMLGNNGGTNQVWEYGGSGTNWTPVTGTNTSVSQIVSTGNSLFMSGTNDGDYQVWEYGGSGTNWTPVTGTNTIVSAIAGTGTELFMLGCNSGVFQVWEYGGSGTNWTAVTGTNTSIAQMVSVGSSLYITGNNGSGYQVWEYGGSGTNWTAVTGTNTHVIQIGVSAAELFMLGNDGGANEIWEYLGPGGGWTDMITDPVSDVSYSPALSTVSLFNSGGPSYLDVEQGVIGDCWLLASLAEVADRDPKVIQNMFVYDGTTVVNGSTVGVYSVQFFSNTGIAFDVKVDTELPSGGDYYDHLENDQDTQVLWVALAEKAYAEANTLGLVTTRAEGQDSYDAMGYGDPTWAEYAITGKSTNDSSINPSQIAADWKAGCLIVLCTPDSPPDSYIEGSHCYAVVGYNASGPQFELFNPWGTNTLGWAAPPGVIGSKLGLFWASGSTISQNFDQESSGTGAADTNTISGTIEELTVLAAFSHDADTSGTMHSTRHGLTGSVAGARTALGSPRSVTGNAGGTAL